MGVAVPVQRALKTLATVWDVAVFLWQRSTAPDARSARVAASQQAIPLEQNTAVVRHDASDAVDARQSTQTVRFGLDGQQYEIDLSDGNAEELREAFARYIAAGRAVDRQTKNASTTGNRRRTPRAAPRTATRRTAPRTSANGHDPAAIREWARAHGHQISDRGPIPGDVRRAYDARRRGRGR